VTVSDQNKRPVPGLPKDSDTLRYIAQEPYKGYSTSKRASLINCG